MFLAYYYNIIMLHEIFVVEIAIFKSIAIPFQPPEIDIVTPVSTALMEITLYIYIII